MHRNPPKHLRMVFTNRMEAGPKLPEDKLVAKGLPASEVIGKRQRLGMEC